MRDVCEANEKATKQKTHSNATLVSTRKEAEDRHLGLASEGIDPKQSEQKPASILRRTSHIAISLYEPK